MDFSKEELEVLSKLVETECMKFDFYSDSEWAAHSYIDTVEADRKLNLERDPRELLILKDWHKELFFKIGKMIEEWRMENDSKGNV